MFAVPQPSEFRETPVLLLVRILLTTIPPLAGVVMLLQVPFRSMPVAFPCVPPWTVKPSMTTARASTIIAEFPFPVASTIDSLCNRKAMDGKD